MSMAACAITIPRRIPGIYIAPPCIAITTGDGITVILGGRMRVTAITFITTIMTTGAIGTMRASGHPGRYSRRRRIGIAITAKSG